MDNVGRYITGFRVAWGPLAAGLITMMPVELFSHAALPDSRDDLRRVKGWG